MEKEDNYTVLYIYIYVFYILLYNQSLLLLLHRISIMLFCCKLPNYYSLQASMPPNFAALDYTIDHHHHHNQHQDQQLMKSHFDETSSADQNDDRLMVNYLLNMNNVNNPHQQQQLSFADVMQFADFGPKLGLNQTKIPEDQEEEDHDDQPGNNMVDPVYFLKFPVLNDKNIIDDQSQSLNNVVPLQPVENDIVCHQVKDKEILREDHHQDHDNSSVQLQFLGEDLHKNPTNSEPSNNKNKRKRPRIIKTSEEVESQRMTHIAVERNRRKQMNEHLRVLRSLMPGSYVQRVRNIV